MNPRAEIEAFSLMDSTLNGNVRRLARMVRAWNEKETVLMPGYLIDATVYQFLSKYNYGDKSFEYYDWISRDYFDYLVNHANQDYWVFPGSGAHVKAKYSFRREAKNWVLSAVCGLALSYYQTQSLLFTLLVSHLL